MRTACLFLVLALAPLVGHAERQEFIWPTPNQAFAEGKPNAEFIQPTASGVAESGEFGSVRSSGAQFHEGIDIRPVRRNRQGEPTDPVFVVYDGVVRHVNRSPGKSNYGRYVVVEHPELTPAIYTLYAHLSEVPVSLAVGQSLKQGETIGTMGRSSSNMAIPRDRAHLHFEMGLWVTRDFQRWYDSRKFGSKNDNGLYNGMNLMGFDPLDFYHRWQKREIGTVEEYFKALKPVVTVRVSTRRIPDFVERYPVLLGSPLPTDHAIGGWKVEVNETGLPLRLTPLSPTEMAGIPSGDTEVVAVDEATLKQHRGKHLVFSKGGGWKVGRDLDSVLEMLFGVN